MLRPASSSRRVITQPAAPAPTIMWSYEDRIDDFIEAKLKSTTYQGSLDLKVKEIDRKRDFLERLPTEWP